MSVHQEIASIYWAHAFDAAWRGQAANQNEETDSAEAVEMKPMPQLHPLYLRAALRHCALVTMEADERRKPSYRSTKITTLILVCIALTWLAL